jgi:hypothetical protein
VAWERNGPFFAIIDTTETTDDPTFHNGIVQRADFRLISSHYSVDELLQIAQPRKNSPFTRITENVAERYQENLDILETTRMILKSSQTTQKETANGKTYFLLQISSKNIKLQILQDLMNLALQRAR